MGMPHLIVNVCKTEANNAEVEVQERRKEEACGRTKHTVLHLLCI